MFKFGDIFESHIYEQMSKEMGIQPPVVPTLSDLIQQAHNLPTDLKSFALQQLGRIEDIFKIINPSTGHSHSSSTPSKNIFGFILKLSNLISELNFSSPKGAIKILYEKSIQIANSIISAIAKYYQNKTINFM